MNPLLQKSGKRFIEYSRDLHIGEVACAFYTHKTAAWDAVSHNGSNG
jgi:hypothetical protein